MAASRQEIIFKKVIHKLSDGVEKNTKLGSIYSMLLLITAMQGNLKIFENVGQLIDVEKPIKKMKFHNTHHV